MALLSFIQSNNKKATYTGSDILYATDTFLLYFIKRNWLKSYTEYFELNIRNKIFIYLTIHVFLMFLNLI